MERLQSFSDNRFFLCFIKRGDFVLQNIRLAKLVIENENHTCLSTTNFFIKNVRNAINKKTKVLKNQIGKSITTEKMTSVRLSKEYSMLIYVNPEYEENPQFACYENATGNISLSMHYDFFKNLLDEDIMDILERAMDSLLEEKQRNLTKPGTMEKARMLFGQIEKEKMEGHINWERGKEMENYEVSFVVKGYVKDRGASLGRLEYNDFERENEFGEFEVKDGRAIYFVDAEDPSEAFHEAEALFEAEDFGALTVTESCLEHVESKGNYFYKEDLSSMEIGR